MRGNWIVGQLGARMRYAVPRILHGARCLSQLYTDICGTKGWPRLLHILPSFALPPAVQRLKERIPSGINRSKITAFTKLGLRYKWALQTARSSDERMEAYIRYGREFTNQICRQDLKKADSFYLFSAAALEVLQYANDTGKYGVLEQPIAPKQTEVRLLQEEQRRFEDWTTSTSVPSAGTRAYASREQQEWEAADLIVCGSQFVKDTLMEEKGGIDKCVVVPYGVRLPRNINNYLRPEPPSRHKKKINVLTVGAVNLRKGAPYVMQIAKRCQDVANFRMVGSVDVDLSVRHEMENYVDLTGHVPYSEVTNHYIWADIFLLPSICEGSATATYEALAAGIPVLCTPNTGSIVENAVEGFIVPMREADGFSEKIHELASDRRLLDHLSKNARQKYELEGNLHAYRDRLLCALGINT